MDQQKEIEMSQLRESYDCPYTDQPITVDGHLDEAAWDKAEVLDFFIPVTFEKPISPTEARMLWDDDYLYVGFKAWDKDIWSYLTERDSSTCSEDVLEVFVKPDAERDPYYNFEINALNTVFDAYNVKRGAGGNDHHRWSRWDCQGLQSAVFVKGTMNNWEDEDEFWQLEVGIPFADLPTVAGAPNPEDIWLFHLSRYDWSVYLPEGNELSSCAPLTAVDFHRYEDWMPLRFCRDS